MGFWSGKRVFITGHTGLRGSWLSLALQKAGAEVFGFALAPAGTPNFFEVGNVGQNMTSTFADVRDENALKFALQFSQAEVVFHLAGGGGLKESWDRVSDVYSTQVMGTVNLFEALRETATVRSVVVMSSDKVYRSGKDVRSFVESDPLAGNAPAAAAKACAELIVESCLNGFFSPDKYNKHKIAIATARMGAVTGGGDFASDSLMFQLAQACQAGLDLPLKNPDSVRPWFHVSDAVEGLMLLGQALVEKGPKASGAWNLGASQDHWLRVSEVKRIFGQNFSGQQSAVPTAAAGSMSVHAGLNCAKAHEILGWSVKIRPEETIALTARWFKDYYTI